MQSSNWGSCRAASYVFVFFVFYSVFAAVLQSQRGDVAAGDTLVTDGSAPLTQRTHTLPSECRLEFQFWAFHGYFKCSFMQEALMLGWQLCYCVSKLLFPPFLVFIFLSRARCAAILSIVRFVFLIFGFLLHCICELRLGCGPSSLSLSTALDDQIKAWSALLPYTTTTYSVN